MASSNRTGLGINKKRSQQVLKTSIDVLQEYSKWADEENEDSYLAIKDLHTIVYDDWREQGRHVVDKERVLIPSFGSCPKSLLKILPPLRKTENLIEQVFVRYITG